MCEVVNFNDMPDFIADIENLLINEGLSDSKFEAINEDTLWEVAKDFESMPSFTGLYIDLLFSRFESYLSTLELDCKYKNNFRASYFYIDDEDINDIGSLKEFVKERGGIRL